MPNLINQIQIGNTTYDLGYPLIEGGGSTDATAKTSTWTGSCDGITSYYDGLTIRYKIGVAGQTTTTLNINDLGAKQIYRFGTTTLTTHFPVGSIINLVYHADLNDGCWMCNDYDANTNTQARTYKTTSTATYYPVLTRYSTSTPTTYTAEYTRYTSKITANHGSGYLKAVKFIEDGVELEDKYSPIGHGHTLDAVTDTTTRIAMTPAERTKLAGIATNANNYNHPTTTTATGVPTANSAPGFGGTFQVNQVSRDALGHVSAITARTITIPSSTATTTTYGLMSASDKVKLDGIMSEANKYILPTATTSTLGGVKIGSNITLSNGTISLSKTNVTTALGYTPPTTNTTYATATTTANGLMSATDKVKLNGIEAVIDERIAAAITIALNTEV